MKKGSIKYWQEKLLPKYLETPTQEEIQPVDKVDDRVLLISLLATIGSFAILGATFLAMAFIINIIF